MPVPKFNLPKHKPSETKIKARIIMSHLTYDMNYDISDMREAIRIIESIGTEKFNFDYPYGSFEAFKQHVFAGEFDVDPSKMEMTDEDREKIAKGEKEGKIWHVY